MRFCPNSNAKQGDFKLIKEFLKFYGIQTVLRGTKTSATFGVISGVGALLGSAPVSEATERMLNYKQALHDTNVEKEPKASPKGNDTNGPKVR